MSRFSDERLRQFCQSTAGYMTLQEYVEDEGRKMPALPGDYRERAFVLDQIIKEARELALKYLKEE